MITGMFFRAMAILAPLALITACTNAIEGSVTPANDVTAASPWTLYEGSPSASPAGSFAPDVVASGTFLPYRAGATAITYDPAVVPAGATAQVSITTTSAGMAVGLAASGLVPRRAYGAHLHTKPCAALPAEAGPHYQHTPDPAAAASPPSVDPSYANPHNEVWLDFTTDAGGTATATAEQAWRFAPGAGARSLILHTQQTSTSPGTAGTAGARVACLTLPAR
jgi:Cu-Zn family superoxide dismutase